MLQASFTVYFYVTFYVHLNFSQEEISKLTQESHRSPWLLKYWEPLAPRSAWSGTYSLNVNSLISLPRIHFITSKLLILTSLFLITKELLKSGLKKKTSLHLSPLLAVLASLVLLRTVPLSSSPRDQLALLTVKTGARSVSWKWSMERLNRWYMGNINTEEKKKAWRDKNNFEKREEGQNAYYCAAHILSVSWKGMKNQTCIKQQKGKMGKQNRKEFSLVFSSYWDSSVAIVPCGGLRTFCSYLYSWIGSIQEQEW